MRFSSLVLVTALVAVAPGCFAVPAVGAVEPIDTDLAFARLPFWAEQVEVPVADGRALRGFFVAADAGATDAPVVLHLLESAASVAATRGDRERAINDLAGLGFSSLAVDWSGLGTSDGKRSIDALERDAKALWKEAVHRAGGADRVVIRATSLGTLAAADLLSTHGARPAAMILIAPVIAESAPRRMGRELFGGFGAFAAEAFFRDMPNEDLVAALGRVACPLLVINAERDFFLDDDEQARLVTATEAAGGSRVELSGVGHVGTAVHCRALIPAERRFLSDLGLGKSAVELRVAAVLRGLEPQEAARFENGEELERLRRACAVMSAHEPRLVAAAALAYDDAELGARAASLFAGRLPESMGVDDVVDVISVADPAGALPLEWFEETAIASQFFGSFESHSDSELLARAESLYFNAHGRDVDRSQEARLTITLDLGLLVETMVWDAWALRDAVTATNTDDAGLPRRLTRSILRSTGYLEREKDGGIEIYLGDEWVNVRQALHGSVEQLERR